jgi:hypothetical protein
MFRRCRCCSYGCCTDCKCFPWRDRMGVDRQKGDVVFVCDACNEVLETNTSDWDSALNMLRRQHWRSRKEDDEWVHYCDKCIGA